MELARRHLQMDVAFLAEFGSERQTCRAFDGDAESFGLISGDGSPLADAYCPRVIAGDLPPAIPNTLEDLRVRDLRGTSEYRIGS